MKEDEFKKFKETIVNNSFQIEKINKKYNK